MIKNNESTDEFKIVKAKKRKERKERYKLNGNESCLHDYANDDDDDNDSSTESVKKRKRKLIKSKASKTPETEQWILETLRSLAKTTNQFISFKRIYD